MQRLKREKKTNKFLPSIYLHKRFNGWDIRCSAKLLAKTQCEALFEITGSTRRRKKIFLCQRAVTFQNIS